MQAVTTTQGNALHTPIQPPSAAARGRHGASITSSQLMVPILTSLVPLLGHAALPAPAACSSVESTDRGATSCASPVPEPQTYAVMLAGLAGVPRRATARRRATTRRAIRVLTLATAALLVSTGAHAATVVSASGSCGKGVGGLLDFDPSLVVSCSGGTWVDPRPGTASIASWSASVANGHFRAMASSAVNTLPPLGQGTPLALGVSVQAVASLSDDLVFDVPGLAGTPARMAFSLWIDGDMSAVNLSPAGNAASRADWSFKATTASNRRSLGSTGAGGGVTNFYDWGLDGDPDVDALYAFELPVVLGQTVTLSLSLEARAYASGWRSGSPGTAAYLTPVQSGAMSNFGNTALWQGITSLTLNDGTPLPNWTLSSSSGFDYASPVPEPGTWGLLAGGLALLAARRKWSAVAGIRGHWRVQG